MTARLVPTASEEEWLAARRAGITASEIAVVMGLSPAGQNSPYALYHRKTGALPDIADNDAMERGRVLEPYIVAKFAERRPEFTVTGTGRELYRHPDRPWQMATPDRLLQETATCGIEERDGIFEVVNIAVLETKSDASPGDEWGDDGTDEIPVHYRCQVLQQCDVIGVDHWFLACLFIQPWKVRIYEGFIDGRARADLKLMREEAREFLDRIDLGDPPDVDWRPATRQALNGLHPDAGDRDVTIGRQLAISYRAACRRYKDAERRKDEMTNRVLSAIGDGRRAVEACTDKPVATRSVSEQRRVSATLVRERHPAVAAECTVTSTVAKLIPAKLIPAKLIPAKLPREKS